MYDMEGCAQHMLIVATLRSRYVVRNGIFREPLRGATLRSEYLSRLKGERLLRRMHMAWN